MLGLSKGDSDGFTVGDCEGDDEGLIVGDIVGLIVPVHEPIISHASLYNELVSEPGSNPYVPQE